jgi:hypothetical protein
MRHQYLASIKELTHALRQPLVKSAGNFLHLLRGLRQMHVHRELEAARTCRDFPK